MKAERMFLSEEAYRQLVEAERLGLTYKGPSAAERYTTLPFFFDLKGVTEAYITTDNYINITLFGRVVLLKNEKSVWEKIKLHLS